MLVGIIITNLSDTVKLQIHPKTIDKFGEPSTSSARSPSTSSSP
jgi:hypothetical protein